jgi:hypothetical protein
MQPQITQINKKFLAAGGKIIFLQKKTRGITINPWLKIN